MVEKSMRKNMMREHIYWQKVEKQCFSYVVKYYRPVNNRFDVEIRDIVGEMMLIIWQSYKNANGVHKLILDKKLLPTWQVRKIFLNALRNLKILQRQKETFKEVYYYE